MTLTGRTVAVLAAADFQELELWYPVLRGREEGAAVHILTSDPAGVSSHLGYPLVPDAPEGADPSGIDALVVAGAVAAAPAFSVAQKEFLRQAHANGARVFSVGNSAGFVRESIGDVDGDRWTAFESADDLPRLVSSLREQLQAP